MYLFVKHICQSLSLFFPFYWIYIERHTAMLYSLVFASSKFLYRLASLPYLCEHLLVRFFIFFPHKYTPVSIETVTSLILIARILRGNLCSMPISWMLKRISLRIPSTIQFSGSRIATGLKCGKTSRVSSSENNFARRRIVEVFCNVSFSFASSVYRIEHFT